jgi:hypothetical protein
MFTNKLIISCCFDQVVVIKIHSSNFQKNMLGVF